jgi:sugar/nucleoside kinase (ribokinase family)
MDIGGDSDGGPNYVLVGHLTRDVFGSASRLGGTVVYAGVAAGRLGRRVGIVTAGSYALSEETALAGAAVASRPSESTTTFQLFDRPNGRALQLLERATPLTASDIPPHWIDAEIVHFAPIADEVSADVATAFSSANVFATPQGWLRAFAPDGTVSPAPERALDLPLERFAALVLSAEDLANDAGLASRIAARVPTLVLTRGAQGCSVFHAGRATEIPAPAARVADPTGAGDVFAAAFFVRLVETDDPVESARFASYAAALAVEATGTSGISDRASIAARRAG